MPWGWGLRWLPDVGASMSEGELISKIRARLTTRLSLLFTRGATDQHGSQMREREVFLKKVYRSDLPPLYI